MDPSRFWGITPRLMDLELRGLKLQHRRERLLAWDTAMLPYAKDVTFEMFVGDPVNHAARAQAVNAAWDRVDRALARQH